jgi:hypothetical protein
MKFGESAICNGVTYWLIPEVRGACGECAFEGKDTKHGECTQPYDAGFSCCYNTAPNRNAHDWDGGIFTTDEVLGLTHRLIRP